MKKSKDVEYYKICIDLDQDPFIEEVLIVSVKRYRGTYKFTINKNDKVSKLLERIKDANNIPIFDGSL